MSDCSPHTWILKYVRMFRHIIELVFIIEFQAYAEGKGATDGKGKTDI